MAHIGTFKAISNGFEGELFMLPLTTKGVRVVKIDPPMANKKAPSHRIMVGRSEIGSAWSRRVRCSKADIRARFRSVRPACKWSGPA